MTKGLSLWLDVLRSAAALAVLFGHMAHIRFTGGDYYFLREINIASDAVVVFFVISGLVIAFAAGRDATPGLYAFNRITRLLTVIVPALILTMILDAIGTRLDPSAYPAPYYQPASLSDYMLRGLTLTTEWTGFLDRVRLGTNGPLWSLSYEAAYYLLFGVAIFARGFARVALMAIIAVTVGLPILLLFPAWLIGVLVWKQVSGAKTGAIMPNTAWVLIIAPIGLLILARIASVPELLSDLTVQVLATTDHHAILGYSDEVLWNMLIALAIALHLVGVAEIVKHKVFDDRTRVARSIRWFAGATFSIYAIHYPVLHMLDSILPSEFTLRDLSMLALTLATSFAFAHIFERPVAIFRRALRNGTRRNRTEYGV